MSRSGGRAGALTLTGLAALGAGMILVVFGVIVPGLFVPGTWVLVLGFVLLAAAGVVHVAPRRSTPNERVRPRPRV